MSDLAQQVDEIHERHRAVQADWLDEHEVESYQDIGTLLRYILTLRAPVTAATYGPTLAADINALPDRLRSYVHDLETRADPTWDVRRAFVAEEKAQAAEVLIQELTAERDDRIRIYVMLANRKQECDDKLDAVSAERDAFTAALSEVRKQRPDIEKIRSENWLDDHASFQDVDTLLAYITDLQRIEAAGRQERRLICLDLDAMEKRAQAAEATVADLSTKCAQLHERLAVAQLAIEWLLETKVVRDDSGAIVYAYSMSRVQVPAQFAAIIKVTP